MEKIGKLSYSQTDILGKGRFSTVCKGTLHKFHGRGDVIVAVKLFSKKDSIEVKINHCLMSQTKHPNIIHYYHTYGSKDFKFVMFEYCAGTLEDVVHGRCEGPPDPLQQITSGLIFLHSLNIVHGHLKPSNILVSFPTGNNLPKMKLADFGLCYIVKTCNKSYNNLPFLTNEWKAPESNLTPAFDVYSLARIFCFFLSKGLFPSDINFVELKTILEHFKEQEPLTFSWSVKAILELVNSMLSYEAINRPTASQVLQHPVFAVPSPEESLQGQAGPSAQVDKDKNDDDDLIMLPPPPKKVFEIVNIDSSSEDEEAEHTAATALIDNPLTKLEEDISDNLLADSNFSESAPSNDERPIPTAASKRTQVIPTSKVSPPPKKINVDPVNLQPEEQAIINSDSSDSDTDWNLSAPDDEQRPRHQSSEPTQEDDASAVANVVGGRKHGRAPCCQEEEDLLKLCGQEGLSDEEMARLLQLLTNKDININCCSKFTCNTPLMLICSSKSDYLIGLVTTLLQREDVDLSLTNRHGHSALTLLCRQSQNASLVECVRLLVNRGMDVAVKDCYNRCALHLLCQYYKGEDLISIALLLTREDMDVKNCVQILRGRKLCKYANLLDDLIHSICRNPPNLPPADLSP